MLPAQGNALNPQGVTWQNNIGRKIIFGIRAVEFDRIRQ